MRNWHLLQDRKNGCVPSCYAMVAARCNVPFEPTGLEPLSAKGFDLTHFPFTPEGLRVQRLILDQDAAGLAQVRAALAQPGWLLVTVCGPQWMSVFGERKHPSFGRLCEPGSWGPPFHSVCITAETAAGFLVLDPWLPSEEQPLVVSSDELMRCVAGQAVIVTLP